MRHFIFAALILTAACTDRPYRLPYADGTELTITADHKNHQNPPEKMFDLRAAQSRQVLVAAESGWVREIKDSGDSSATTNNYVWIEHPLDYCQPVDRFASGTPQPSECRRCSNGLGKCNEWTLYAHMEQNSVRGFAGLSEDDWVEAGQPIGIEGDVGFTPCGSNAGQPLCGRHLHFAIFQIDRDSLAAQNVPSVNGDYEAYAAVFGRTERVPLFCTAAGYRYPRTGDTHVAAACP
ncbi:MAG: M23 family metallopeptidase [Kiloniellales bacterium]